MAVRQIRFTDWQQAYLAAVSESDRTKLLERVTQAEIAIRERLQTIGDNSEQQTLFDAMATLQFLKQDAHADRKGQ